MKITRNDRLLALLSHALETTLIPELNSSNARAIAGIMQNVLQDLIKRESRTPSLVASLIAEGTQLADQIKALLAQAGLTPGPETAVAGPASTLADGLQNHAALTEDLAHLTEMLAGARGAPALAQEQALISSLLRKAAQWELNYNLGQEVPLPPVPKPTPAGGPLTAETLTAFLQSRHPDGAAASILNFQPIPGGFGKQTARFTLRDAAGREQHLIARKSDVQPMLNHAGFIIETEFFLVKALSEAGYLSPKPLWLGTDIPGVDANFYVMERLPGQIPGSFLGGLEGADPQPMLLDVARQLGRLHSYPIETFAPYIREHDDPALLGGTMESCYRRLISKWRHYATETEHLTSPLLHYLFDWLEHNVPADTRPPVLVHGDFNIHNLLVENGRVSGVLDWECAMFGAPEQDLTYIQPHITPHIDWDQFIAAYYAGGGRQLDTATMPFYLSFAAMRLHIAMLRATRNLQTGVNDDIRYAMVELGFGARFMEMGLAGTNPP
jgi:aminoglycoside phosphotransferase (APT) family kinase protein